MRKRKITLLSIFLGYARSFYQVARAVFRENSGASCNTKEILDAATFGNSRASIFVVLYEPAWIAQYGNCSTDRTVPHLDRGFVAKHDRPDGSNWRLGISNGVQVRSFSGGADGPGGFLRLCGCNLEPRGRSRLDEYVPIRQRAVIQLVFVAWPGNPFALGGERTPAAHG